MYVRFVVLSRDEDSHCLAGIFQAAYGLRERGVLGDKENTSFDATRQWFAEHLAVPARLTRSRRPNAPGKALCWFKPTAFEHITRARELAALLEPHGVPTRMLQTERPGYVLFEDEHQVAAVPFRKNRA